MIYLASPYSHPDYAIRNQRYLAAHRYCRFAMNTGKLIFSPIVYGHEFAVKGNMPFSYSFWKDFNDHMLLHSYKMEVLMIDGVRESEGVAYEIALAAKNGIPIEEVSLENL
jgi:hypothetical protein